MRASTAAPAPSATAPSLARSRIAISRPYEPPLEPSIGRTTSPARAGVRRIHVNLRSRALSGLRLLRRFQLPEHAAHVRAILAPEEHGRPGEDDAEPKQQAEDVRPGQPDEEQQEDSCSDEVAPPDHHGTGAEVRKALLGVRHDLELDGSSCSKRQASE